MRPGTRVVVIEDNEDSRELLCQLLSLSGFECSGARDGQSGLDLVTDFRPDVAIIDVGLPGIDGFEVARRLRADARHRDVYLIALTGYGQQTDRDMALEAGFDEHVVKPVQPDKLARMLAEGENARQRQRN